jgi:hypothetical protein
MTFYWTFVDTLVKNVATISAIVVGVSQFLIRAFNENNGANKVRKFINQTLFLVNRSTSTVYELVNANALPIQEVKVTKTNKRTASK